MRTLLTTTATALALAGAAHAQTATADEEAQEELLRESLAEGEVFEQSPDMATSPVARGTDGLNEEGEPIDAGAGLDVNEGLPADDGATVVVVEDDGATPSEGIEPDLTVEGEEPLREVDITGKDLPPIEDAENVVPENDLLKAETGLSSPSHTAPNPGEGAELAVVEESTSDTRIALPNAPEGFAVADMGTMDVTELLGVRVYTLDDDNIGEIDRWIGERPGALPEGAVIDVGGFLGIGAREVAIGTEDLTLLTDLDGDDVRVYVEMTEEQLEMLPELD